MRIHLQKRDSRSTLMTILVPVASLLVSFLLGAIVLALSKADPLVTYRAMLRGAFGNQTKLQYTIAKSIPLLLCGLAVGVAFRLKFWNIGAEGQYIGPFAVHGG